MRNTLYEELTKDTSTLGLSINEIAYIVKSWGEDRQFDTPTSLKTREERILMNEKLMLVVTEVAEACEALRKLDIDEMEFELADVVIRVLNLAGSLGIDLDKRIADKMEINRGRPIKHGKDC